jgi:undecaprenol kinase/diacylglycerol kinase (ATP)
MQPQPLGKAFIHAFEGLFHFIRNDRNGKIHFIISLLVCIAGIILHLSTAEWMIILLCMAIVLGFEMCNHALEKLCDAVHPDHHPLVKIAKDVAAAAVLWSAIIAVIIGLILFVPKILMLL